MMVGLFILTIYIGGIIYFNNFFLPNTYTGPVNISQMTLAKAKDKVMAELSQSKMYFEEGDQGIGSLSLDDLDIQIKDLALLDQALKNQPTLGWPAYLINKQSIDLTESLSVSDEIIDRLLISLGVDNEKREHTRDMSYTKEEDGSLRFNPELYGDYVDPARFEGYLLEQIGHGKLQTNLKDIYDVPKKTMESEGFEAYAEEVNGIVNTKITLKIEDHEITIPREEIESWLTIDSEGNAYIDSELIADYIYRLNMEYATLYNPFAFNSTYQGEVTVQPGIFGWYIDSEKEQELIIEALHNHEDQVREATIEGSGYGEVNSIGDSYVEVDLTYQMMFIYHDGQLMLETPIVSGITGAETVPGAYQIWNMQRDAVLFGNNNLTGLDYETPVDYWIAFDYNAQGIHDAPWQSAFGGNIWTYAGSLGCINTPPAVMPTVFELCYIGMPVMIFH